MSLVEDDRVVSVQLRIHHGLTRTTIIYMTDDKDRGGVPQQHAVRKEVDARPVTCLLIESDMIANLRFQMNNSGLQNEAETNKMKHLLTKLHAHLFRHTSCYAGGGDATRLSDRDTLA